MVHDDRDAEFEPSPLPGDTVASHFELAGIVERMI